jgi:hypothetical protein
VRARTAHGSTSALQLNRIAPQIRLVGNLRGGPLQQLRDLSAQFSPALLAGTWEGRARLGWAAKFLVFYTHFAV